MTHFFKSEAYLFKVWNFLRKLSNLRSILGRVQSATPITRRKARLHETA